MKSLADRRVTLFELARSREADCKHAIDRAYAFWSSLEWTSEGLAYRKHVVKNFSRLLQYFYEECLDELRQQTPKTRLEADKDFWEAKRAADHLEGNAEKAMMGELVPTMVRGAGVLEGRVHPGRRVHGHHADELHLRHPRHPDRRLLPQRLADDLQGAPVQRHHEHDAHQDAPRRGRRPARGPQARGVRRRHRAARRGRAHRRRQRDGQRRDGEDHPGACAACVR